jgi:O-antigen/teichoic acid export membrane protein
MSTTKRIISGSTASWVRIAITIITQIALVPIFLTYWDVKTYGIWIAIQALINILSTLDRGYSDFLQYEFLKLGNHKRSQIGSLLWSALYVTILIAIVELAIVYLLAFHLNINSLFGEAKIEDKNFHNQIAWALLVQWIAWMLTNIIGLFFRSLYSFGYHSRTVWWGAFLAIITSIVPVLAVIKGAGLLTASIWSTIGIIIVLIILYMDIMRILQKEQIVAIKGSWKKGFKNYAMSIGLSGRYFLENFRQQGVRLLVAPFSGATGLAAFTTIRTGANVALQGLSTITNPLMPELMRFLQQKEQKKIDASFDTIWLVLIAALAPGVVVMQAIAPAIFASWTKGQINFDARLFATLSLGVLVYALAQPATAIVIGNNLIKSQVFISLISTIIVIAGIILMIPSLGILAAGIALLIAEIVATVLFQIIAKKWLYQQNLDWPQKSSFLALLSVMIAAIAIYIIIVLPAMKWLTVAGILLFLIWNTRLYWKQMTPFATGKANSIAVSIPIFGKLIKACFHK